MRVDKIVGDGTEAAEPVLDIFDGIERLHGIGMGHSVDAFLEHDIMLVPLLDERLLGSGTVGPARSAVV